MNILHNSNQAILPGEFYLKDLKCAVWVSPGQVVVRDLANALQRGKVCKEYTVYSVEANASDDFLDQLRRVTPTFNVLVAAVMFGTIERHGFKCYTEERPAMRTFSPFVKVRPIKPPRKWTISHVWKAILAGQITQGWQEWYFTDDYAFDVVINYRRGQPKDLLKLAKDLIERPSGWHVWVDKETDKEIYLSVNCHLFDCNTLVFKKEVD